MISTGALKSGPSWSSPIWKVYVILYDEKSMYFPRKALKNPYNGKPAYCGGFPQFFGGKIEKKITWQQTLIAEVFQESQGLITLTMQSTEPPNLTLIHQKDGYAFYACNSFVFDKALEKTLKDEKIASHPLSQKLKPQECEMLEIYKIEAALFASFKLQPDDLIVFLLKLVGVDEKDDADGDWRKSHTRVAFVIFLMSWLQGKLPKPT